MKVLLLTASIIATLSCQKPPNASLAIDPLSSIGEAPLGSKTSNDDLKKELKLLDDLLEREGENLSLIDKKWLKAKLLFQRRRLIESAMLISEVLEERPGFNEARNLRARALFFLGNPFMALKELEIILQSSPKEEEKLDGLYLTGAFIFELEEESEELIKKGISAWNAYLAHKNLEEKLKKEVEEGLKVLKEKILLAKNKPSTKAFALLEKARSLVREQKFHEALVIFSKLIKNNPTFVEAYHYQGMAFMMKGDIEKAKESWQKTIKLDPNYAQKFNLSQRIDVADGLMKKVESH